MPYLLFIPAILSILSIRFCIKRQNIFKTIDILIAVNIIKLNNIL
nr:MAG TPA: hypothetical protein [Caudoviricetes sp.]